MKTGNENKEDRPFKIRDATNVERNEDKGRRKTKGAHKGTPHSPSGSENVVFAPFLPFCQWLLTHVEAPQGMEAESKEFSS